MPRSLMLERAAQHAAALSEEKLVSNSNTLMDPFSAYIPCNYCTTLLRNKSDRSHHVVLSPACLEAHRLAVKREPNTLPVPDTEDNTCGSMHHSLEDLPCAR